MLELDGGNWRCVGAPDLSRLHLGHPPGGAQDRFSHRAANLLLGNERDAGAIEFTLLAPTVRFVSTASFVLGGAPCNAALDGAPISRWSVVEAAAGSILRMRLGGVGCRGVLAVAGGVGEALEFVGDPSGARAGRSMSPDQSWAPAPGELRVTPGPEFSDDVRDALAGADWTVSPTSSWMGVRLVGGALGLTGYDIVSSPTQDGTVQATPAGPIALLRERGTLGGYPRVAQVIDPDVDRLAQLRPGNPVKFRWVSESEALAAAQAQEAALQAIMH